MPDNNGNVKWFHLIWIVGMLIGALYFMGSSVIANDRIRAEGDEKLADKIAVLLKENNEAHMKILTALVRVEAKLQHQ